MSKSYRVLLAVCLVGLMAVGALASERPTSAAPNSWTIERVGDLHHGRAIYVLEYEFDNLDFYHWSLGETFFGGDWGILPTGAVVTGFGYDDIMVFLNGINWADEVRLEYTFWDGAEVGGVGVYPFVGVFESGLHGPVSTFIDITALPQFELPPPADPFEFITYSVYNDGTGMPAGHWVSGTVYVLVDSPVVDVESASLSAVKALFN